MALLVVLLCSTAGLVLSNALATSRPIHKSLMGPPSEFPRYVPPSPFDSAVSSRSLMLPWAAVRDGDPYVATFAVDSSDYITVALISTRVEDLRTVIRDASGVVARPSQSVNESIGMDGLTHPTVTLVFVKPVVGKWLLEISTDSTDLIQAAVLIGYSGQVIWHSSVDTHKLLTGSTVNIMAVATDQQGLQERQSGQMPKALKGVFIDEASVTLFDPNGTTVVDNMQPSDSGDSGGTAFSLAFQLTVPGTYIMWTSSSGVFRTDNSLVTFQRSSWMMFNVVDKSVSLTGAVQGHREHLPLISDVKGSLCSDRPHFWITAAVKTEPSVNPQYRVYAEVWGRHFITGKEVAIAWISGMSDVVQDSPSTGTLSLRLDLIWLLKAEAFPPYSLRQVRVEETGSFISVSSMDYIPIVLSNNLSDQLKHIVVTNGSELNMHLSQSNLCTSNNSNATKSGGKLILVHGYCSQERTFPESDFTDVAFFEDFKQSRTTDTFARLILEFGEQYESFGLAAHSHGGVASLHLYTYYESGLDKAEGERLIQTIGTPYHGSPLAELLASIGKLIGIGCGPNPDLSYDSMERWLAAIPAEKQQALHYYTTQYKTGGLINYCLLPSNLILSWPNDGLVEKSKTDLPFGQPAGHSEGECHTSGMHWPPQTKNAQRNEEINRLAAR